MFFSRDEVRRFDSFGRKGPISFDTMGLRRSALRSSHATGSTGLSLTGPPLAPEAILHAHLRIARPVSNLTRTERMYRDALELSVLARFEDHDGFPA